MTPKIDITVAAQFRDVLHDIVERARKDARDGNPMATGKELVDRHIRPHWPDDIRQGDADELMKFYSAARWVFEIHARKQKEDYID